MVSKSIENIIIKYVTKSIDSNELDVLIDWIEKPNNFLIFKNYVKTHYAITISMNDPDPNIIRERLLKEIRKEKSIFSRKNLISKLKYAAIAIVFLGLGYLYKEEFASKKIQDKILEKEGLITLELENGNIQILSENGDKKIVDTYGNVVGEKQGSKLIYGTNNKSTAKLVYNTLTVPYGKRFDLNFSDGTHVFLNSGSSIKYPINFIKGQNREVFLNGEAFFDVAKDENHPFIVNVQELNVNVLGTKFNVSNYPEDNTIDIVLVEGSVNLNSEANNLTDDRSVTLKPNFKGSYDRINQSISKNFVNTSIYTSWINGNVIFRNSSFKNISEKLERYYNITIINNNNDIINEKFNASFNVNNESIEEVLSYFNKVYEINYEVINNKVIIK